MAYGRIRYLLAAIIAGMVILSAPAYGTSFTSACGVESQSAPPSIRGYFDEMKGATLAEFQNQGQPGSDEIPVFPVGDEQAKGGKVKSIKKAFLYSLIIPGAGQVYNGSKIKAALFLAFEAASWTGYFSYQSQGDNKTDDFNLFADTYWSQDRYEDFLDINWGVRDDDSVFVDDDPSAGYYFTHHLPETKTQQYYEMIGKYNQFVVGWADVDTLLFSNPEAAERATSAMRLHYEDMRYDANRAYDHATTSLIVMMVNHVASAFEAALSAKRNNDRIETDGGGLSIRAIKARSGNGQEQFPMLTMRYRF
ncbi:MAG: hypothetical protein PHR28_01005 [candidate division Zixibacteria bacterium]|nr:hypothetical protein [candidate division Zixibacteria bacterium]